MDMVLNIAGHVVSFEQIGSRDAYRVRVDGNAVPMKLEQTESTWTNSGSYDKVLAPFHEVFEVPLAACLSSGEPFQISSDGNQGHRASCTWASKQAEMYNTVIYDIGSIVLVFPADLASVAVTVHFTSDTSS